VESNVGHLEFKMCELLNCTTLELGEKRRRDPRGVAFLERHVIWEANEKDKHYKEMERKSNSKRRR